MTFIFKHKILSLNKKNLNTYFILLNLNCLLTKQNKQLKLGHNFYEGSLTVRES